MSNCSLKPTNNAGWKVPLLEGAPHCCCWVLQLRVVQNANVFFFFSKGFENPDSRLFSRVEYNVTIQGVLTLKTSMAAFLDMSKWACVLTSEPAVPHNRFLWSNSWRSLQRRLKQVAWFPQKIGWTVTSRGFSCEPCRVRGRVGRLSARLQTW